MTPPATRPHHLGKLVAACFAAAATAIVPAAAATDVLLLKNGERREGQVTGVSGGNVQIQVGPAQSSLPLDQVERAIVAPPEAFESAQKALADGNPARAINEMRPLVQRFRGLPADWVRQAYAGLGEALIQMDQLNEASKVFDEFTELYPDGGGLSDVAIARLEVARGELGPAKNRLAPIVAEASELLTAEPAKSATYGRAFLLMGQIREAEGNFPEALQDYLRTVTIFYADSTAVAEAQSRAEALADQKNVIAP